MTSADVDPNSAKRVRQVTDVELVKVWAETLQLEHVDMDANVFELGADSLAIVQVCMKLREIFDQEIRVSTLFRFPTIRSLAEHLRQQSDRRASRY
ncbi:acyl carrier protein [Bradyrhizobium prioriisuperbiae]|uniref:acyl carrier protein n=1 Tax=Bradyrhizobium prioriisuperbiae TaxID=2854389 RepID=UPI0028EF6344|nr:phosphopantetheine-binding protein [Bradyrhizobium prioritasuperba]